MKTSFKSSSNLAVETNLTSNFTAETNLTSNFTAGTNLTSNIDTSTTSLSVDYLKFIIDTETGRYIEADTESRPDYVILKLFSAKGALLDTTEFNVSGAASARVISCEFDLEHKQLIITNSDLQNIVCDLSVLLDVIDTKVTKVPGKDLSTNDYTDIEKTKVRIAYIHSQTAHAPADAEKNVQSNWSQTDVTKDDFIKNKPFIPINHNDLKELDAIGAHPINAIVGLKDEITIHVGAEAPIGGTKEWHQLISSESILSWKTRIQNMAWEQGTVTSFIWDRISKIRIKVEGTIWGDNYIQYLPNFEDEIEGEILWRLLDDDKESVYLLFKITSTTIECVSLLNTGNIDITEIIASVEVYE